MIDLPQFLSNSDGLETPIVICADFERLSAVPMIIYFRDSLFMPERLPLNTLEREEIAVRVTKAAYFEDSGISKLRSVVSRLENAANIQSSGPKREPILDDIRSRSVRTVIDQAAGGVPANDEDRSSARASAAPRSRKTSPELNAMLAELDGLIGLSAVKNSVRSLVNLVRVRQMRAEQGLPLPDVSLHTVFAGNPGTGKTTVARLIAKIYAHIGVLRKGQLVEVDRSGLVAGFIGQTAIKTMEAVQRSLDGVLFIDEAYSLAEKGSHDFGAEAIEILLKGMEDNRSRLIVIVAGYAKKMAGFIDSNPGLKSRFSRVIEFPDYTASELLHIADHMARQHEFVLERDARDALENILKQRSSRSGMSFGNARGVRNVFESIMDAQANRIVNLISPGRRDLQTITLSDVISSIH
jgi:Cdc6-like AAA superfamily ATPase